MYPIQVISYNQNWLTLFTQEKNRLQKQLDQALFQIHHIGSTAIPGMPAKPILDILLEVATIDDIAFIEKQLLALNYTIFNRNVIPHRSFFTHKMTPEYQVNCHIFEMGDPQVVRYLRFRDYLSNHKDEAATYAALKNQLAKTCEDIGQYVMGKSELVRSIDAKAKLWDSKRYPNRRLPQNKGLSIEHCSVAKITQVIEANFTVMATHFMQYLTQIHFQRIPGYVLINTMLPEADFNLLLDTHLIPAEAEQTIVAVLQRFSEKSLPFTWWITPSSQPETLGFLLAAHNFHHQETRIAMLTDLDKLPSQSSHRYCVVKLENSSIIREISGQLPDEQLHLKQYLDWIAAIYTSDDPIAFYAVFLDNTLIRCTTLVLYSQCAGIYHLTATEISSDPSKVIIENFLLEAAKQEGYHLAFVMPRDNDIDFYKARGFIPQCAFQKWQYQPNAMK